MREEDLLKIELKKLKLEFKQLFHKDLRKERAAERKQHAADL